ncbi:hypothetical protein ANCDUO_12021 [Ancylostoma duodenale]|uniref:Serine-threonine/tyrosine-protein kinase catalytic domain-containing protein n=1 Tax=Ancylostoma duodenale TaxID=51022 RepID=A0A0C2G9Z0_9BILA|nr:hypothetical protein ANCDUO_12021 [Ancylostoma duodenale]
MYLVTVVEQVRYFYGDDLWKWLGSVMSPALLSVVLWEISSFGMLPYFGVDNFDVMGLVTNGGRLDAPNTVPVELQDVMRNCWNTRPEERPSFSKIVAALELLAQREELAHQPICCLAPTSSALVSPVVCSAPMMPSPSISLADTPCTVVTALSPMTPDRTGFGVSMTGVPYIPINTGALREVFAEKSTMMEEQRNPDLERLIRPGTNAEGGNPSPGNISLLELSLCELNIVLAKSDMYV